MYSYDVFGKPTIRNAQGGILTTSAFGNRYMFAGREWETETGLYYYRARYYKPDIGRFLQPDPVAMFMQYASAQGPAQGKIPGTYMDAAAAGNFLRKDPIGRFLSLGALGMLSNEDDFGVPVELNLYRYCSSNSINWVDPFGLFRFGKRPLKGLPWIPIGSSNPIDNYFNTEISHEHGFFEDGPGGNIGFGPGGRFSEDPTGMGYRYGDKHYDDALIREALKNVKDGNYSLIHNNCQDWCDRLRDEYERLEKERKKKKEG